MHRTSIVQVKRYTLAVSVEAVRALNGIMADEQAQKGFMVTTSSFGPAAHSFCENKPIELIDGDRLLKLLRQYLDMEACIAPA